jgi:capsid protein
MAAFSDRLIAWFDPAAGVRRHQARKVLAYYEAAKQNSQHKSRRDTGSANDSILRAGASLRQQARHFEQNYDLALGVLNTMVANIIGPSGIGIEPQPRRADGSIDDALARQILDLWRDWTMRP